MANPSLKSLPYASHITNLLHIKNISLGNWEITTPTVTPINMNVINKMLVAGTIDTLRVLLYKDPPPTDLSYTERVITLLNKAKHELIEFGKDTDHIPDYHLSSKRKSRKPPSASSRPPPQSSTPTAPSSSPPPPPRETREDRVLSAIARLSMDHQRYAEYTHLCLSQIHQEQEFLSQKLDAQYHCIDMSLSLQPSSPPPPPVGFPFFWPPPGYSAIFPSSRRPEDAAGTSGAGPSGTAGGDAGAGGGGDGDDHDAAGGTEGDGGDSMIQ